MCKNKEFYPYETVGELYLAPDHYVRPTRNSTMLARGYMTLYRQTMVKYAQEYSIVYECFQITTLPDHMFTDTAKELIVALRKYANSLHRKENVLTSMKLEHSRSYIDKLVCMLTNGQGEVWTNDQNIISTLRINDRCIEITF